MVKREEAEKYCRKNGFSYYEVSAKTGENINNLFKKFVEGILYIYNCKIY